MDLIQSLCTSFVMVCQTEQGTGERGSSVVCLGVDLQSGIEVVHSGHFVKNQILLNTGSDNGTGSQL